jgi:hypothetical protein
VSLRARALDHFVEPRTAPPRRDPAGADTRGRYLAPVAPPAARGRVAATRFPLRAAVLGTAGEAVPVGALLANALRCKVGASTAALATWAPSGGGVRGGVATPSAARLAARMAARGLPAVARGRLAWMPLEDHPVAAAVATRRASGALEVPFVVVLAGPRCAVIEGVLAEQDLVVVAAAEPEGPLARLAVAGCVSAALACAPPAPGPSRWAARSGVTARGLAAPLRSLVRGLAQPGPQPEPVEPAW